MAIPLFFFWVILGFALPAQADSVNFAYLHGVASANSEYYPASRAIDGDRDTSWAAASHGTPTNPYWLQVDLENQYSVDQIVLVFTHSGIYAGYTNVYNLYNSTDGTNWNLIQSGTLYDSTTDYVYPITLNDHNLTQFVKYEVIGGTHWAQLYEMEIYGNSSPVPLPPAVYLLGSGLLGLVGFRRLTQ